MAIHASEAWVGEVDPFPVTITITSEENSTSETVTLFIQTALPILKIVNDADTDIGVLGLAQGGFAPMDQTNQFYLSVVNSGLVDAHDVQVEIFDESGEIVGTQTLDVPMGGENTQFTIDITPVNEIGSVVYTIRINTTGLELAGDQPTEEQESINYQPNVKTKANNWLGLAVGLIIAGLIGLFWKFSGRRGSQAF